MQSNKTAVIIGAGPAGLTAALELLHHTDIKPIVFEASGEIGGISRTVNHNGNRMDIGGHRFFSKSDWVMSWWLDILPLEKTSFEREQDIEISYQNNKRHIDVDHAQTNSDDDRVMLVRSRLSRIYYLRKFFDYPVRLNLQTIRNLGLVRIAKAGLSYIYARVFPRKPENTLEDFLINRFGQQLYLTFFKSYTEKVWGVPCDKISAEWGAQRIKGLSISKAVLHALKKVLFTQSLHDQKKGQTSLIERFLYPKYGPGQLWEIAAERIKELGGEIVMHHTVIGLFRENKEITRVKVKNSKSGVEREICCDYVLSTMPVKELILGIQPAPPEDVTEVASALPYRDFITIGLLVKRMLPNQQSMSCCANNMPPDNWIYIQEPDVKLGRLQIFNNWSLGMIRDPKLAWIGLEYFCNEGDELWKLSDQVIAEFAASELAKINLIEASDVLDSHVIRIPKAYPAYYGSYAKFGVIRNFVDDLHNLFLVGRNGMHRYNNQDHSMLTAKLAIENIVCGRKDKANIWAVNIDDDYHEENTTSSAEHKRKDRRREIPYKTPELQAS